MSTSDTRSHARLLQAIARAGRKPGRRLPGRIDPGEFIEAYYRFASTDELAEDPSVLAAGALDHLHWGSERTPQSPKVRVFNPAEQANGWTSAYTIVETITDDSPFIVDSLTMQLNSSGHAVISIIHPVLKVARDEGGGLKQIGDSGDEQLAESWVRFEIPRVVDSSKRAEIERAVEATLRDVKLTVQDWSAMLRALGVAERDLRERGGAAGEMRHEACQFLNWLARNHFTLLGYCRYRGNGRGEPAQPVPGSGLGLLRRSRGLQRQFCRATPAAARARYRDGLIITKAPMQSTIHRPAPLDDISVSVFDEAGDMLFEHRFIGLFTSIAYTENPSEIPLLRLKIRRVMKQSRLDPLSHRGKALRHILDTLPRDELIQATAGELRKTGMGILALAERHRTKLFFRRDPYDRFFSCLVYLPRDQYSATTRKRVESLLEDAFRGEIADSQLTVSESALARLSVTIRAEAESPARPNITRLQDALGEAVKSWADHVRDELLERLPEAEALTLFDRIGAHFPPAYQDAVEPARAYRDVLIVESLGSAGGLPRTALLREPSGARLTFTILHASSPIELYRVNPILENMSLRVLGESNYSLDLDEQHAWIQDFELEPVAVAGSDFEDFSERFQACFTRTLLGKVENDGFNSLVVSAGLDWRQCDLLRAYCRYLLQTRLRFSQAYMLETLTRYPGLVHGLVDFFAGQFDPRLSAARREAVRAAGKKAIDAGLNRTESLDDDRILRAFASTFGATLRTNFYQSAEDGPKDYTSFKLDPAKIPDLPRPRPRFEIFVYSQRMEGVHLRCGEIARGGLRWSDRREDFRTEILGLMKAQQVKNTVIVPTGAKGGFVCKSLPAGDRDAVQAEVIACYKTFIRGMLDITDNIVGRDTVTPPDVLPRDGADPYLVVAADKGTAAFSDIANSLSAEYGFWLGDAFASGGSAGYDHKKMAITARGAWESVKRHFRETGLDTQSQDFTVAGIGDMGGDVFGNGMLLSPHIRLIATFNHQHIFIDPDPDPAISFAERKRLFDLPRSSWDDYARDSLSTGGGVFDRKAKSISLHPAACAALGIEQTQLTPPELIQAILRAPVDLLWNGGIGTYVKASSESNVDAGDPVNDAVRVNGDELRCKVVGEGGNLGFTQLGRIEFSLAGGRINTDFIDNSGGVDSSDREVNIKILLGEAIRRELITKRQRNALLKRMTNTVAQLVLASNYAQTQALSMMSSHAAERLGEHAQLMRILESRGMLDRALEFLPGDEEIEERRKEGNGLTRPELAVILSYAKIELFDSLVASDIPDEPHCQAELVAYFPKQLTHRFGELVPQHPLHRQIAGMLIASSMINRMGPFFMIRAEEETGADAAQVARCYAIARSLFATRKLWREIESLDGSVQAQVQYDCFFQISRMMRRAVYWLLHRGHGQTDIDSAIERMGGNASRVLSDLPEVLCGLARKRFEHDAHEFESLGVPRRMGEHIASLRFATQILDIAELADRFGTDPIIAARTHFELGRGLRFDWLREEIEDLEVEGQWRAMARGTLRETLGREQQDLLAGVLKRAGRGDPHKALTEWLADSNAKIARMKQTFDDMQSTGQMDFATLSIALKELSRLGQS